MFASTEPAAVRDAALQAADRIGARLVRDAVRDGRRAAWLGDQMELVNNQWAAALKPTGPDLCAGAPGIAMFLARLHKFTGERLFRLTADAAFGHAVSRLESIPAEVRGSLWSGWAGISWALLDAGSALDNAEWTERGLELAGRVARLDQFRRRWMSRPAAPACSRFSCRSTADSASRKHSIVLVATANCCCHRRGKAIAAAPGRRCRGGGLDNRDLTGLSHGASGVALALFELAAATGELRFREAAERGFEYEQQYFSSRHNNWPDFRELMLNTPEAQWNYSLTWCHGARESRWLGCARGN